MTAVSGSLDNLVAHPELVTALPRDVALALLFKANALVSTLALAVAQSAPVAVASLDDTLTTEQAARLIGVARRTLTRGARTTYRELLLPTGTRRLAFSRKAIEAWQAQATMSPDAITARGKYPLVADSTHWASMNDKRRGPPSAPRPERSG